MDVLIWIIVAILYGIGAVAKSISNAAKQRTVNRPGMPTFGAPPQTGANRPPGVPYPGGTAPGPYPANPGQSSPYAVRPAPAQTYGAAPGQPSTYGAPSTQPSTTFGTQPGQPSTYGAQPSLPAQYGYPQPGGQPSQYGYPQQPAQPPYPFPAQGPYSAQPQPRAPQRPPQPAAPAPTALSTLSVMDASPTAAEPALSTFPDLLKSQSPLISALILQEALAPPLSRRRHQARSMIAERPGSAPANNDSAAAS